MELRPYQKQAVERFRNAPAGVLYFDVRMGKTITAIELMKVWGSQRTLVVCPKKIMAVWQEELGAHYPGRDVLILDGPVKDRVKAIEAFGDGVVVLNYDVVMRDPIERALTKWHPDAIILDESHRAKSASGKASRALARIGKRAEHRLALTGTLMPNSPMDVFGQFRFLDPSIFGTSIVNFRDRYCIMGGYQGYEVLGWKRQDEMGQRIGSITERADSSMLDLTDSLDIRRPIDLPDKAMKLYRKFEREMVIELETGEMTAPNVLTKLLRLQQITSGYVQQDDGEIVEVHAEKREALKEFLEDLPASEPVVVFARFTRDLENIHKASESVGRSCYELSGRRNDLARWQQSNGGEVLAAQIQAGSEGVSMVRAAITVMFSMGYSLGTYTQCRGRIDGTYQTRDKTYIHLVARDTVDEAVYSALQNKQDVVDYVVERLRAAS